MTDVPLTLLAAILALAVPLPTGASDWNFIEIDRMGESRGGLDALRAELRSGVFLARQLAGCNSPGGISAIHPSPCGELDDIARRAQALQFGPIGSLGCVRTPAKERSAVLSTRKLLRDVRELRAEILRRSHRHR